MTQQPLDHFTDKERLSFYLATLAYYQDPNSAASYSETVHAIPNTAVDAAVEGLARRLLSDFLGERRVLDAGCGNGYRTHQLAQEGLAASGCDASPAFIALNQVQYPEISFRVGDLLALPYEDRAFKGAFYSSSLVHFPSVGMTLDALREAGRVMVEGGWLFTRVKQKRRGGPKFELSTDKRTQVPRLFQYYEDVEFADLLLTAGFKVTEQDSSLDVRDANQGFLNFFARKIRAAL